MNKLFMIGAMIGIGIGVAKFIKNNKKANMQETQEQPSAN